ncbi:hypothetical protein [Sinorhizobium medicae]
MGISERRYGFYVTGDREPDLAEDRERTPEQRG